MVAALVVHTGKGARLTALKRCTPTWPKLAAALGQHDEREHKDGGGLILAEFSTPERKKENVTRCYGLVTDLDTKADPETGEIHEPPPIADVVERVRAFGLAAVIYTTHNHEAPPEINEGKPQGRRYRLALPLAEPIEPDELETYTRRCAARLGVDGPYLDRASWTPSQFFYAPSCRPGAPRYAEVIEGRPLTATDLEGVPQRVVERAEPAAHVPDRRRPTPLGDITGALLAGAVQREPMTVERVRELLKWIKPTASRDVWMRVGFAVLAALGYEEGLPVFEEWSRAGTGYVEGSASELFRSDRGGDRDIGPGTLVKMARDGGWTDASARDERRRAEQQAENERLQELPFSTLPPSMTVDEMRADCVWIAAGSQVGRISNPRGVLSFGEFVDLMAASVSIEVGEDGRKRRVQNAVKWKHSAERQTVHTRTFHAGAGVMCTDPDGLPALNSWRPIERWPAASDVAPFIEQVGYLFADAVEREAFLDWLAHIEQRPGVLPHYGWLHIAASTGTGRNWLASVLARVWRGYVAPNVDLPALLDSQFNGQLAGRVLAVVDEVQEAAGENPYRHANKLKSLVNAEYRELNPKFGRQYREHNACRWLVFSNHDNALPLNDTDRRWRVVRHTAAPRAPGDYAELYALLADAEFINAVGVYLRERDNSGFNPGERPPMSEAKRAAVNAAKTLTQRYAEELASGWPADVVTNADAASILSDGAGGSLTPAMRRALEEVGAVSFPRSLKVNRQVVRSWVLRNHSRWLAAASESVSSEAARARSGASAHRSAAEVLAGNGNGSNGGSSKT